MDLNRANFLLRAYLRTRLVKACSYFTQLCILTRAAYPQQIEEHVFHIMGGDNSLLMRLSPQELTFAQGCALQARA
jgi:hypothetical protein